MTHIEQAIREAVEGGWMGYRNLKPENLRWVMEGVTKREPATIFLDPLFWQALGKARGWNPHKGPCQCVKCVYSKPRAWNLIWHRFIDHLAEGKYADSFFKDL